jgi:hypothetical protein
MRPQVKIFQSSFTSWNALFEDAAQFASEVGPERLIGIWHSEDKDDGVVTVWHWERAVTEEGPPMRVRFRWFHNSWSSWDSLFREAAAVAEEVGPARLIGISHSEDKDDGVVAVWYWEGVTAADE